MFGFWFLVFGFCAISGFAQIKVDASGNAIFGKQSTLDKGISIVDENISTSVAPLILKRSADNRIHITRAQTNPYSTILIDNQGHVLLGKPISTMSSNVNIPLIINSTDVTPGIQIQKPNDWGSGVEVVCKYRYTNPFVAVGPSSQTIFNVDGYGIAYSNGNQLTSDLSLKSNIEKISNPLDKVMQMRGVVYDMKFPDAGKEEPISYETLKKYKPEMTAETFNQIREEKSRKRMGVIAQEVENVVPEVVRTREDGLKSVGYSELVGLLIEAIKEQQYTIDELSLKVATLEEKIGLRSSEEASSTTGMDVLLSQCVLSQNAPNPFSVQTEIKYYLTDGIKSASICIFDMSGKMLETYPARQGQNSITIEGSKLQAGMYLYSLIANGQVVDTKRMVLTK